MATWKCKARWRAAWFDFATTSNITIVEPLIKHDGLMIEHVQRFDHTVLLPESSHWRRWMFQITLSGTRYLKGGGQTYLLAPNMICWSGPLKEPVSMRHLPGTGSATVLVQFSGQRWQTFLEQHPVFRVANGAMLRQGVLALTLAAPQVLHVLRQLTRLKHAAHVPGLVWENHCALLLRLLAETRFDAATQRRSEEYARVEAAQAQIVARLAQPPSLPQLACSLGISTRQLQRDFLACTGMTSIRYINLMRLSEANFLLAETTLPISEIAVSLGYTSAAHFSAAFRQLYNCSPRAARDSPEPVVAAYEGYEVE